MPRFANASENWNKDENWGSMGKLVRTSPKQKLFYSRISVTNLQISVISVMTTVMTTKLMAAV